MRLVNVFAVGLALCASGCAFEPAVGPVTGLGEGGASTPERKLHAAYRPATPRSVAQAPAPLIWATAAGYVGFPFPTVAEGACPGGRPTEPVGLFSETPAFSRDFMRQYQRSTVRITPRPITEMESVLKQELKISHFHLGLLANYAEAGQGHCTGLLITSNIIMTAGHCVSPRWFYEFVFEAYKNQQLAIEAVPQVLDENGQHVRYFEPKEIARMLKADFEYKKIYTADAAGFGSTSDPSGFSENVSGLIASKYENPNEFDAPKSDNVQDFALLRLNSPNRNLKSFAFGLGKLNYRIPPRRNAALAIVQHPNGWDKQVATGTLSASSKGARLSYANLNTEGGSSGAAIVQSTGQVVGIHTRGGCGVGHADAGNRGMSLTAIKTTLNDLSKR